MFFALLVDNGINVDIPESERKAIFMKLVLKSEFDREALNRRELEYNEQFDPTVGVNIFN